MHEIPQGVRRESCDVSLPVNDELCAWRNRIHGEPWRRARRMRRMTARTIHSRDVDGKREDLESAHDGLHLDRYGAK